MLKDLSLDNNYIVNEDEDNKNINDIYAKNLSEVKLIIKIIY